MKRLLLFYLLIPVSLSATVRTVCNSPATIAQFSTIQAAINASVNGDTILVQGSPVSYSGFTLNNKRLVMIGPGFIPNVSPEHPAYVNNSSLQGSGCKHSVIQGMYFYNALSFETSMDSITVLRNYFGSVSMVGGIGTQTGFIFRGNYFFGLVSSHPSSVFQNFIFENNVFRHAKVSTFASTAASFNILFNHNLFITNGTNFELFFNLNNALFTNNIFVKGNFNSGANSLEFCTFINNITYLCDNNTPWTIPTCIDGGGNVAGMDPQMIDMAAVLNGTATALSNYTIPAGPANNAGSDGKDMGLLYDPTGGLNWTHTRNSRYPHIYSMTIANPVVGAGSNLNVTINARKNE